MPTISRALSRIGLPMSEQPTATLVPLADLHPAPWNPRTIRDDRFLNLCESIKGDPEFIWRRPVLAQADGTIYAGNMRYRAAEHLGMDAVPAIVEDIPDRLAKERALRDNAQWGDWDDDELARLVGELQAAESNLDLLGLEETELKWLIETPEFAPVAEETQSRLDEKAKITCPACGHAFAP